MSTGLSNGLSDGTGTAPTVTQPRAAASKPAGGMNIARAWQRHRTLAIAVASAVTALVLLYGLTRPVRYQADVIFYVSPVQREILQSSSAPPLYDAARYEAGIQQYLQTMQRMDTALAAVRTLPEGVWRHRGEPIPAAAARLLAGLSVERVGESFQLNATLQGSNAQQTTEALNALAQSFLQTVKQEESGGSDEQLPLLLAEQARVQKELADSKRERLDLGASMGVARLGSEDSNPMDAATEDLRKQLSDLQHTRDLADAQIGTGAGSATSSGGDSSGDFANGSGGLIGALSSRKATLETQMSGMTPANPIYQQDEEELQALERRLSAAKTEAGEEARRRIDERRHRSMDRASALERQLRDQLAHQTAAAVNAGPKLQRYAELGGGIERLETKSGTLDDSIRSLTLESSSPARTHILVPPVVPLGPVKGKRRMIVLAALPAGLIAGLLAAVLMERRDKRIFLSRDVEAVLGFKPMAVLPADAEVSAPVQQEYWLRLAAAVENSYRHDAARTFVFTAASNRTDVETLVHRVQIKLKELGYSALWVGADTLLRAEKDFEEAYGRGPSLSAAARGGSTGIDGVAAARLAWLKRDYDLVLVDAPPLTASGEAEYAVRRCDATIVVNESGVTTREDLHQTGSILERIGPGGVGAVLQGLYLHDADMVFCNAVKAAEMQAARATKREPRDASGLWELPSEGAQREARLSHEAAPGNRMLLRRRDDWLRFRAGNSGTHTVQTGAPFAGSDALAAAGTLVAAGPAEFSSTDSEAA